MAKRSNQCSARRRRLIRCLTLPASLFFVFLFSFWHGESPAQEKYPNRPITIVVPFPPGGVADLTAGTSRDREQ